MFKVRSGLPHLSLAGKVAECSFQLSKFQDGDGSLTDFVTLFYLFVN